MTGSSKDHPPKVTSAPDSAAPRRKSAFGRMRWPLHGSGRALVKRVTGAGRALVRFSRRKAVRRSVYGLVAVCVVVLAGAGGLWWRLLTGPIELDLATPFLKAAIEKNLGSEHTVDVGGTQIERDEKGRTSLRLRDIVVRDRSGTVVASAPKAEVGLSGTSLFAGQLRAESLNLVGAALAIRIEADGQVTVFAGADKRPIATSVPPVAPVTPVPVPGVNTAPDAAQPDDQAMKSGFGDIASALAWLDSIGAAGLDGHDLRELGLKNGSLTVDDRRGNKHWTFDNINASITRPLLGGVTFRLESENPQRPWVISAAMRPLSDGVRAIGLEARKVAARDLLLALRLNESGVDVDLPLSMSLRADVAADGTPNAMQGQLVVESGSITQPGGDMQPVLLDHADFRFNWDPQNRMLLIPFQVQSGGAQFTLRAGLEMPRQPGDAYVLSMTRGDPVIDPIILPTPGAPDVEGIALNRANLRARIDLVKKRIDLEQGDFRRIDTRPDYNIGLAVTGRFDYAGAEPQLAFGVAATRMPLNVMKRLWPFFAAHKVRNWVVERMAGGMVERVLIAGNAPLSQYDEQGPPMSDEGISVDIQTSGTTLRPVDDLPPIRDADLTVRVTGATARVALGRATVELDQGRKLAMTGGLFDVPDTHVKPSPARTTLRIDGTLPAVAALLATDALRDSVALNLDPATSRGTVSAQVALDFTLDDKPGAAPSYAVSADITNFSADKMVMGQRVEAQALKVSATSNDGYAITGDVKINATAARIDLRKKKGDADAELNMTALLDEAARKRLNIDFGTTVTGSIPIKVNGRFGGIGGAGRDEKFSVEADLTPLKIDNLLPGWTKAAGKQARATYTMVRTQKSLRFDDLSVDGAGASLKGSVEIDNNGDLLSAKFPAFALSETDKAQVTADRGNDGAVRVTMRGDVFDGRNFIKSAMASTADKGGKAKQADLDIDLKLGTVVGHDGETMRGLDLKMSRRNGRIRTLAMNAKIGRDTPLIGDLRLRARDNHQVVYLETDDAGALLRFTDIYPKLYGGQLWVALDAPTADQAPQAGTLYIRAFSVRGEPTLDRVISNAPGTQGQGVEFSEMRTEFTRFPGKMAIREGVVRGPLVGATIEGQIDYARDEVHLRGTFVPFYGLNNMFGQIPIVGLFLGGGSNEGLLGITFEAVGSPGSPRITINPVTAIAPGLLRKFIPSPGTFDRNFVPPTR